MDSSITRNAPATSVTDIAFEEGSDGGGLVPPDNAIKCEDHKPLVNVLRFIQDL